MAPLVAIYLFTWTPRATLNFKSLPFILFFFGVVVSDYYLISTSSFFFSREGQHESQIVGESGTNQGLQLSQFDCFS